METYSPPSLPSTISTISKHQDTQVYDAILPQHLTNQAMLEFEAYMTYHSYATGKRIKTIAKGDKPVKKKQFVTKSKGLTVLSEVALTKAEQIKLATKRSLIQTHSSYANSLGADEGTGSIPGVPDVPTYESDDEQISWKSSEEDDDDEVNFTPTFHSDDEARQDDEVNEEESDDESNEDSDEEVQGANIKEEEMDEEATHEEDEVNELYRDVNVNLEGRDTEMTDAPRTIV
ncbi:hypothetical protein Tco_0853414 [Tanacetum coccineum]